jgi:hypothetical protein
MPKVAEGPVKHDPSRAVLRARLSSCSMLRGRRSHGIRQQMVAVLWIRIPLQPRCIQIMGRSILGPPRHRRLHPNYRAFWIIYWVSTAVVTRNVGLSNGVSSIYRGREPAAYLSSSVRRRT